MAGVPVTRGEGVDIEGPPLHLVRAARCLDLALGVGVEPLHAIVVGFVLIEETPAEMAPFVGQELVYTYTGYKTD